MLHLTGLAIVQGYIVQHFFPEYHFRTTVFTSLCLNVLLYAFYRLLIYPYFLNPLRHLPTIPGRPHVKIIFDNPRGRIPLEWIRTVPNEGLIHFRNVFSQSMLLVTNHQALLDVMSSRTYDFEKPWRARDFLARIIGFGLILSEGQAHRKQRRALTPAFNIKNIRALYGLMWEKTGLLLDEMESELQRNPFEEVSSMGKIELSIWASRLTLDIIGPAAMGRDFRSLHNPENKVADSFSAILEPTREKMAFLAVNFVLPQWFAKRLPWSLNEVVDNETGFLRDLCNEIVQEKRAAIVASGATAKELEADILGTMMMGGDFTDDELVDQMLTFLAAGVRLSTPPIPLQSLTGPARNNSQRPDLGLLPPHPPPTIPRPPPRRNSCPHPLRQRPNNLVRPRIYAFIEWHLPRSPPPLPNRPSDNPRIRPRHHRRQQTRPQRHEAHPLPVRYKPESGVLGTHGGRFLAGEMD